LLALLYYLANDTIVICDLHGNIILSLILS